MKKKLISILAVISFFGIINFTYAVSPEPIFFGTSTISSTIDDIVIGGTTPAAGTFTDLTYTGTLTPNVYKTVYIDAGAMVPCTTNGALAGTYEYGTHDLDHDYYAFDTGATKERVQFKSPMPEDWDRGTVKAKFYWSSATSSTANDTCEWGVKAQAFSNSDANDAAFADAGEVISDVLLADNGEDAQLSDATPAVTVGGTPALGDMVVWEFWRNTDGTDNMAEDGWLKGVIIQYKANNAVAAW